MTNRDFLKQVSTDGLPDAATVLEGAKKPRSVWRRVAVAVVAAVAIGAIGTAAAFELGIITIGPAAEQRMSMTPEDWDAYDNGEFDMPEFNVDVEIAAMEEYVENLEIITNPDELQQGVEYNVLGISTIGTMPVYAFCEYDPELWDLLWSPEVSASISPLQCAGKPEIVDGEVSMIECGSDKFYFVSKGAGGSFVEDGKEYSWGSSVMLRCAECGALTSYRMGDVTVSELAAPEASEGSVYIALDPIENEDGTYSFRLKLVDEQSKPIEVDRLPVSVNVADESDGD